MRCLFAVSSWFVQRASLTVNIDLSDVTNEFYTVLYRTVVVYEKKIDHWCSVVPEKSQLSGPPFSGKLGKPRFPLERLASGWDFSVSTEHQWWILFFSHTNAYKIEWSLCKLAVGKICPRQASFPTGTVGPRVGIFLSPLNTNDGFYWSSSHKPISQARTSPWER